MSTTHWARGMTLVAPGANASEVERVTTRGHDTFASITILEADAAGGVEFRDALLRKSEVCKVIRLIP